MIVLGAVLPHPPILLPEIADGRQRDVRATLDAYDLVGRRLLELHIGRVLMISTHGIVTLRRFHVLNARLSGNLSRFRAPQIRFERDPDPDLVKSIMNAADKHDLPLTATKTWEESDHSLGVPLRLLADAVPSKIAVVSISFRPPEDHYRLGQAIGAALCSSSLAEPTAILASGDAVHTLTEESAYKRHPRAQEVQSEFEAALTDWDPDRLCVIDESLRREVDESVISPTLILMGALNARADVTVHPRILASEHPWGVGYVTALVELDGSRAPSLRGEMPQPEERE